MFYDFLIENLWFEYFKHKHEEEEKQALAKARPVCCTYDPCITGRHRELPSGRLVDKKLRKIVYTPDGFDGDRFGT
jgi:hypothetical protein